MRSSPFGEWVNVFYDPEKIEPKTMLQLIKQRDCPRAKQTIAKNKQLLNPFIAPGDPVQISINTKTATTISNQSKLPSGWKIVGDRGLKAGANYVTLTVPKSTKAGSHKIQLVYGDDKKVDCEVTVVTQVGKH